MDHGSYTYDTKVKPIDRIEFAVLSNKEVGRISAIDDPIGINIPDLYDNMEPKRGGLVDPHMGPGRSPADCATCGLDSNFCVGHFGHIELSEPVFNFGYIQYVKKILSCICLKCQKLLIYKNENEIIEMLKYKSKKARFAEIRSLVKNVSYCQKKNYGCGTPVSKIKLEIKKKTASINIITETVLKDVQLSSDKYSGKGKIRQILTPNDCYNILKNISDRDCEIMGMDPKKTRPEMMILKIMPVPPVQVRPSAKVDFLASSTKEDDLTHKLADIIKSNVRNRKYKESTDGLGGKYTHDHTHLIQYHVATYFDNESVSLPRSEKINKATRSLNARLKGKEGRIRGNLMGKRVDFSARTVITPDPGLDINQLGVPISIAKVLTFPEVVTPENIDKLQKLVKNGRDVYPGANYVFPVSDLASGRTMFPYDLRYRTEKVTLRYGDIVERHLVDDDYVLLNRQPTLHKLSMMGHRIKVINDNKLSTIRLPPYVTAPYNADFDGDEMNIFVPQSIQSQIELHEIADVKKQVISPRTGTPSIGAIQDGVLGAFNLTQPTMKIDWKDAMNIISYTSIDDFSAFKKGKEYSGTELFSLIIPPQISLEKSGLEIENGIITKGVLTKQHLGAGKGNSIIHNIWNKYGVEQTKNFLDDTARLINNFNLLNGFTVGIGDLDIPKELDDQMNMLFETKKLEVDHQITEMENNPDLLDEDLFEETVYSELNKIRDDVSELIMKNLPIDNNFNTMIASGAKGAPINMGQQRGSVGQQSIIGKRPEKKVNGRTMPYFYQNDDSALARGFVESSYLKGLTPTEFIFHNMAGREGLIDTAIKSVTGDTELIIIENNEPKYVKIGEWIDAYMKDATKIAYTKEQNMELLKLDKKTFIPTTDKFGNISWGQMTAVTRHDPGNKVYQIKTHGGRKVKVVESKSLLAWNSDTKQYEQKLTSEIKIGDYVPVTMNLARPNIISKSVDMVKYFPKNKYVHGTDFIKASKEMEKIVKNGKTLNDWWKSNNGNTFTLPYKHEHGLLRSKQQSKTNNIKIGYIYQFTSNTSQTLIPEKFKLNRQNGLFVGLYLAEGNCYFDRGYIQITNIEPNIQKFVEKWFDNHLIKWNYKTGINKIDGTSSHISIRGYSRILCEFFDKFTGHGANKFVPNEAFSAPNSFIKGLLDGYFSGDGTVITKTKTTSSIVAHSASKQLLNGINMLCNMLGIFGKMHKGTVKCNNVDTINIAPKYTLLICAQWSQKFAKTMKLINQLKMQHLKTIKCSKSHRNFCVQNDTVLDKIISINELDPKKYPKVYDVTVPSTTNFCLASGLHVVDTAESGYVQRKLIKSLEDNMVKNDGTVRNANNTIFQFCYGDNGMDVAKQARLELYTLKMGNTEIAQMYRFSGAELSRFPNFSAKQNDDYYKYILSTRDPLRKSSQIMGLNRITFNISFNMPVNLKQIITDGKRSKLQSKEKLTPIYIIQRINSMIFNDCILYCMKEKDRGNEKSLKFRDEQVAKTVFEYGLNEYLAPKRCIIEYGLNKAQFDMICDEIIRKFNMNAVEPGEMVGIVAAQSLGEPVTQMSQHKDTIVRITGHENYSGKIGEFIDKLLKENKDKIQYLDLGKDKDKKHSILNLEKTYNIVGVSNKEKTGWNRILQVSRHPANGQLVKVTTRSGKTTTATMSHSFLKRTISSITIVKGSDLKVGDRIPVAKYIPTVDDPVKTIKVGQTEYKLDKPFGMICGSFLNGKVNTCDSDLIVYLNNNYRYGLPSTVYTAPLPFIKGIIEGYLNRNIDCVSGYEQLIDDIVILLAFCGKFACKEKVGDKYKLQLLYDEKVDAVPELEVITGIGGDIPRKQLTIIANSTNNPILKQAANSNVVWDEIIELEILEDPKEFVYDFTVPGNDSFMVDCGIIVHNTLNSIDWKDKIIIKENDKFYTTEIGKYIDNKISAKQNVTRLGDNKEEEMGDTYYVDTKDKNIFTISVNKNGKLSWNKINALTKHLPINKDGTHDLVKIKTRSGRIVTATKAKSFLTLIDGKLKPTRGDKIKVGMSVPIANNYPDYNCNNYKSMVKKVKKVKKKYNKIEFEHKLFNDVYMDEIVDIKIVQPTHEYVYDLTVENDKTFVLANGICMYDTFHHAGIGAMGTATLGVPRIKELLSFSKNMKTPITIIYLEKEYRNDKAFAEKLASVIKHTTIKDVRKNAEIIYDPNPFKKGGFMERDNVMNVFYSYNSSKNSCQSDVNKLPWLIRVEMDKEKMMEKDITLFDIKAKFCNYWERRYRDTKGIKKDKRQILEKISQMAILSNDDNNKRPMLHIRFDMTELSYAIMIGFLDKFIDSFRLKGIASITNIDSIVEEPIVTFDNKDNEYKMEKHWVIYAAGINIEKMKYFNGIDHNRTICNDVVQVYKHFGIEAARTSLLKELKRAFSGGGSSINYQHVSVLIDLMTNGGYLTSIDRHGLNVLDTDPLARASFEKTVDQILTAAVFGQVDHMRSVSSRIMAGLAIKGGTGLNDIVLDSNLLENSEYIEDIKHKYRKKFQELSVNPIIDDIINKKITNIFLPS